MYPAEKFDWRGRSCYYKAQWGQCKKFANVCAASCNATHCGAGTTPLASSVLLLQAPPAPPRDLWLRRPPALAPPPSSTLPPPPLSTWEHHQLQVPPPLLPLRPVAPARTGLHFSPQLLPSRTFAPATPPASPAQMPLAPVAPPASHCPLHLEYHVLRISSHNAERHPSFEAAVRASPWEVCPSTEMSHPLLTPTILTAAAYPWSLVPRGMVGRSSGASCLQQHPWPPAERGPRSPSQRPETHGRRCGSRL